MSDIFLPPTQLFAHCPRCGASGSATPDTNYFHCAVCGFRLYLNVACAYAGLIVNKQGQVLFIRRAKEPSLGKLAVPGGFADANESSEEGLRREIREEVGLEVDTIEYLCSYPNNYQYRQVAYPVLDLFFLCRLAEGDNLVLTLQEAEVSGVEWHTPNTVAMEEIAFPSLRYALQKYLSQVPKMQ